jgi:hypothetical protein
MRSGFAGITTKGIIMPRQSDLPAIEGEGVSLPQITEIEIAAEAYVRIRDKRMRLTEQEISARTDLTQRMVDHHLTRYVYDDQIVLLKNGDPKVKVKTYDPMEADPENED